MERARPNLVCTGGSGALCRSCSTEDGHQRPSTSLGENGAADPGANRDYAAWLRGSGGGSGSELTCSGGAPCGRISAAESATATSAARA